MSRLASISALVLALVLLGGSAADAGFPWLRSQKPKTTYAPEMRNYAVVAPAKVASKHNAYGSSMLWADQRPATPVYPWGWFGTHNSPQGWSHTGYYGEYRDHGLIREQ